MGKINFFEQLSKPKKKEKSFVFHKPNITKETKKESYEKTLETVDSVQEIVLNELNKHERGATAKELALSLYEQGLVYSPERNAVHPRLNELVQMGKVAVVGKTTCQYTSRKVTVYKAL